MIFEEPQSVYESITSRMKALAVVRPLLALDSSKVKAERGWEGYRLAELALAAIDVVTLRTDMRTAVRQETVVAHVAEFAALQLPGRLAEEYRAVARWVTERLINTDDRDRAFHHAIGGVTDEGFQTRMASFQILKEVPDPVGQAALIATDAAITVLVHAIDVDIASEQIAAEAKLEALLKRARIGEAWQIAHTARLQSIRYAKDIHGRIEAMKRNVRALDWDSGVKETVDEALEHVRSRSAAEQQLKERIDQLLEVTDEAHKRQQLEGLGTLIVECMQRHSVLIDMLLKVGPEYRRQQDRQVFVAPTLHARVHVHQQLLQPVLELSLDACLGPLEAFTRAVLGPQQPRVMYLPDYFEALTRVSETAAGDLIPVVHDDDPVDGETPAVFSDAQYEAVDALLDTATDQGVRLSALLGSARVPGSGMGPEPGTDSLLAMRVQQLFRQVPVRELSVGESAVVAIDDGTDLVDERFGGSDFLLIRAQSKPGVAPGTSVAPAADNDPPSSVKPIPDRDQESV